MTHHESTSTLDEIRKRWQSGRNCDFQIRVEGETIPVPQVLLEIESEYFRTMFSSNNWLESRESYVAPCETNATTAKAVVNFLFTQNIRLGRDTVPDILKLAHLWGIEKLVNKCETFLIENIEYSSCIDYRKLATMYDLPLLAKASNKCILENIVPIIARSNLYLLTAEEVKDVLKESRDHEVNVVSLWEFFVLWCTENIENFDNNAMCEVVPAFPLKKFNLTTFREYVWNEPLITSCENCKPYAAGEILRAIERNQNIISGPEEAIFLKKLAKTHEHKNLETKVDSYIVQNHFQVLTSPQFVEVEKEDMLKYVFRIIDDCTAEELSSLVSWLKHNEQSHDAFSEIFTYVERPRKSFASAFLSSIGDFSIFAAPVSQDFAITGRASWWQTNCFFLKSLAQRFSYSNTEEKIDKCIIAHFAELMELDDFCDLTIDDVMKYIATPKIYSAGEETVWNAIQRWIGHDSATRTSEFQKIFEATLLGKFSTKFLRKNVITSSLVKESNSCMCYLMEIILQRMEAIETDFGERIRILENLTNETRRRR